MSAFVTSGLVPDVIDTEPENILKVRFGSESEDLKPGDIRTPTNVKDKPVVTWTPAPDVYYTLLCHDPDAPSREDPKFGEFQHWLVVNIEGNDVSSGEELVEYIGSGAPKDTGLHRYVFLLYKQRDGKIDTSNIEMVSKTSVQGRRQQKARQIAEKYDLDLIAGNFFQAEWDEYVPELHRQLGLGK